MTGVAPTQLRVPYVIAHEHEVAPQPLRFARRPLGGLRLAFDGERRSDRANGVLRARVLNNRQGPPQWDLLRRALATQLIVQVHDLQPVRT
ncbi:MULTISPECIES: hypothetical protein [unclassified Streptosporangium]|uniref:hypothetical protein n=1 Tax=unclassified Streptosporangium TaxID=2632669 RepID=UPI002E299DF6|nr:MULTISPECIES: hypothetical protein [unclassified Streptosporangium]